MYFKIQFGCKSTIQLKREWEREIESNLSNAIDIGIKWNKNKPVELKHTHLICIIFCIHCTLYKRLLLSRSHSFCHWWQRHFHSPLLMPICFDVIEMVIWKIWAIKIFHAILKQKKVVFPSFLVAVRACINTWLKSSFEIQSMYNCSFFFTVCLWIRRFVYHNIILKREKYFPAHTNKIHTQREVVHVYSDTTTYICLFGKSSVYTIQFVLYFTQCFSNIYSSSYWKVM